MLDPGNAPTAVLESSPIQLTSLPPPTAHQQTPLEVPKFEPRDQQEAAGRAGGHPPQEHHAQGQHQHPRCGNQQDIDKQTERIKFLAEPSFSVLKLSVL